MLQLPEGIEVHAKSGEDIVLATVASRSRKKSPPLKAKPPKPRLPNKFLI